MKEEKISLRAVNSSQDMDFFIQKGNIDNEDEYYFTLCGKYRDEENMQVDFDCMNPSEFREFIAKCYKLLKEDV
jgi:hypothetical protein